MLQYVAICCSVLQCVARWYSNPDSSTYRSNIIVSDNNDDWNLVFRGQNEKGHFDFCNESNGGD